MRDGIAVLIAVAVGFGVLYLLNAGLSLHQLVTR